MAVLYFGVAKGGNGGQDVTIDSSTTSSDIELAVSDVNLTAAAPDKKKHILLALEAIRQAVLETSSI